MRKKKKTRLNFLTSEVPLLLRRTGSCSRPLVLFEELCTRSNFQLSIFHDGDWVLCNVQRIKVAAEMEKPEGGGGRRGVKVRIEFGRVKTPPVAKSCGPPTQPAAERAARRVGVKTRWLRFAFANTLRGGLCRVT